MVFGRAQTTPPPSAETPAAASNGDADGRASGWVELLAEHGGPDGTGPDGTHRHNSRHADLDRVVDLANNVLDIYIAVELASSMMQATSHAYMLGGLLDSGGAGDATDAADSGASVASGLFGSIFDV